MYFYVYRELVSDVGESIVGSTGLTPLAVLPKESREAIIAFDAQLSPGDKDTLDTFMTDRNFIFVRENDDEPLPGWASDPIAES